MAQVATVRSSSFLSRVFGALRLDPATYDEVASDPRATWQACALVLATPLLLIVLLVVVVASLTFGSQSSPDALPYAALALMFLVVLALLCLAVWLVQAGLLAVVARATGFGIDRDRFPRVLRTLGFAYSPGVFSLLVELLHQLGLHTPLVTLMRIILLCWSFAAIIVALRSALAVTTRRAIAIYLGTMISVGVLVMLVSSLLSATR
jgi:hypothetical protein